ncbi:MAG: methyltransferase domain-containing protein [Bacteroidota bacterium]
MKKILSHLLPITLKKYHSTWSGIIEINLNNGRKVVDTATSNYSYGSLQKILSKGLHQLALPRQDLKNILVLGMGAGSIVQTIREEFECDAILDLVELDETMIEIAKNEFQIHKYSNIKIIIAEANQFVYDCTKSYDLIIIDLFVIDTIPEVFTDKKFIQQVIHLLNSSGAILFNTMRSTLDRKVFQAMQNVFKEANLTVEVLENVYYSNDLILVKRS